MTALGPDAPCAHGLEILGSSDVSPGSDAYYEDRPSLAMTDGGATHVYLDRGTHGVVVARLDASGAPRSVRKVEFSDKHERSHVVAVFRGNEVVFATAVYHAEEEADIEVVRLDETDKPIWTARVDPSPDLDGEPAIVWRDDEIAVVWQRGPYPSRHNQRLALLDPSTGKVKRVREVSAGRDVGVASIVWDGNAYWIAWQTTDQAPGISVVRATADENLGEVTKIRGGANPFLLPTPAGMAVAYDDDQKIWFTRLDAQGKPLIKSVPVLTHPDPFGQPRKPFLAFDGGRFAVAYEVTFHVSVMIARPSEVRLALVDPNGVASPSIALHPETSEGSLPAVAWTGKDWLVVFNRDELQAGKSSQVVASRLACRAAAPPRVAMRAGPCDVRTSEAPKGLRFAEHSAPAVLRTEDGGYAALEIQHEPRALSFMRVGRDGAAKRVALRGSEYPADPTIARRPGGFAAAWIDDEGPPFVALLDESGARVKATQLPGEPHETARAGLAWTPKGLVVAYARGSTIVTTLLDKKARVRGPTTALPAPPYGAGDCALGYGPHGLLLAISSGSDRTEANEIRVMRLDDTGNPAGSWQLATPHHGFSKDPSVVGAADGFLLLTTGPFDREVELTVLGPLGEVVRPMREMLTSYGFVAFGGVVSGNDARVFALEQAKIQERLVCP